MQKQKSVSNKYIYKSNNTLFSFSYKRYVASAIKG